MVTASQTLKMYELLNKHFTNEDAKGLVQELELVIDCKFTSERDRLATKSDIGILKSDMVLLKSDMMLLREEVKNDIGKLETRMEQGFKDQLKWLIIVMVGWSSLMITIIKFT
jgi:hypothetical protein